MVSLGWVLGASLAYTTTVLVIVPDPGLLSCLYHSFRFCGVAFRCIFFLKLGESQTSQIFLLGMVGAYSPFGFNNNAGDFPTTGVSSISNIVPSVDVDNILNPLGNNGGFSSGAPGSTITIQTRSLPNGSPAINAGATYFTPPPYFDQRGSGFPRMNGRVDIGSFEVQP